MGDHIRLYVLPPSHYCERARWALDHMGLGYTEGRWVVGVHAVRARRIAKGTTIPILLAGSDVIQGSGLILDWTGMPGPLRHWSSVLTSGSEYLSASLSMRGRWVLWVLA